MNISYYEISHKKGHPTHLCTTPCFIRKGVVRRHHHHAQLPFLRLWELFYQAYSCKALLNIYCKALPVPHPPRPAEVSSISLLADVIKVTWVPLFTISEQ